MANVVYNHAKAKIMDGTIDLDTDTIYVALVTSSYDAAAGKDADHFFSEIDNEVTGTGYTAGGQEITGKAVTIDDTNDLGKWDGNDVTWASSTITARGAIVYVSTGASTTDDLICYFDFGADKSSSNGDFKITWSTAGILQLT